MATDSPVSVAMATFNGARFLEEQLRTLANQTLLPAELVACDDGSTDATVEILREFARTSPFPVKIQVNATRLNYGCNFLKSASLCSSQYIAFCDQDDIWLCNKLEASVAAMRRSDAVLCTHPYVPVDERGRPLETTRSPDAGCVLTGVEMEPWGTFYGFTCTVARRLLELIPAQRRSIDLIDETRLSAHDRWVYFLAASAGRTVVVPEALALYRQHGANTYGDRKIGWRHKLNRVRTKYPLYLEKRRVISRSHVELLSALSNVDGKMRPYIADAIVRWRSLSREYEARSAVFSERHIVNRLVRYGRCAARGTYNRRVGGGRLKTAGEDLVAVFLSAA